MFLSVGYCAFIDAEHALDPSLAEIIGVKTENLLLSQPDTGEQALSLVDTLIRSGSVDVVVVDSVSPYCLIINSIQIMESILEILSLSHIHKTLILTYQIFIMILVLMITLLQFDIYLVKLERTFVG